MEASLNSDFCLPLKEAARQLPITQALLYQLVRNQTVPAIRLGKRYFLRPTDVDYLKNHGTAGLPKGSPILVSKKEKRNE